MNPGSKAILLNTTHYYCPSRIPKKKEFKPWVSYCTQRLGQQEVLLTEHEGKDDPRRLGDLDKLKGLIVGLLQLGK